MFFPAIIFGGCSSLQEVCTYTMTHEFVLAKKPLTIETIIE